MKICIVSDSHDHRRPMKQAVSHAVEQGVSAILHCGDLVSPSTLRVFKDIDVPVHVIHGNNTGDLYMMSKFADNPDYQINYYGQDADITLGGRRIFMVHYPHYAYGMALTGDYDIVCCGHSHHVVNEFISNVKDGKTLLLNPGTVAGVGVSAATYLIGDLDTLQFEAHTADAHEPVVS